MYARTPWSCSASPIRSELRSFKLLIGVSGVGPRAALSILSAVTPQQLALAVVTEDEKALTAANGIGKKIAQRVILELKDKLAREEALGGTSVNGGAPAMAAVPHSKKSEARRLGGCWATAARRSPQR